MNCLAYINSGIESLFKFELEYTCIRIHGGLIALINVTDFNVLINRIERQSCFDNNLLSHKVDRIVHLSPFLCFHLLYKFGIENSFTFDINFVNYFYIYVVKSYVPWMPEGFSLASGVELNSVAPNEKKISGTQGKNYVDLLRKLSVRIYQLTEHMGLAISHSAEIFFVILLEKIFLFSFRIWRSFNLRHGCNSPARLRKKNTLPDTISIDIELYQKHHMGFVDKLNC